MNVFEDLLVDLKEENLLEDTILEERHSSNDVGSFDELDTDDADASLSFDAAASAPETDLAEPVEEQPEVVSTRDTSSTQAVQDKPQAKGREFFKKRAVAEVSSLQMVEHVLTGVEREYMKTKPQVFDDLNAKLALNKFLQLGDVAVDSEEHKAAEFALMHETEAWCTALADRDKKITVAHLRHYCENAKPALSSQALVALCRFYRNLPYSEAVRSKFDFLITRLFSRPTGNDQRVCLFKRQEALGHLENLYKEWASVPLYSVDDDDSKVLLTALSFDELAEESEQASSFDQLIDSDFFSRLRMFKESISELFFAPQVAISAVEANVRIGNSYVKLIAAEREKMDADSIQAKYASLDHESVSEVTARTLELVDLLRTRVDEATPSVDHAEEHQEPEPITISFANKKEKKEKKGKASADHDGDAEDRQKGFIRGFFANSLAVNKWLLGGGIALILLSIGIYVWANYFVEESVPSSGVKVVSTDNVVVHEHIKTGKVSNETFYGVLNESWDGLSKEKREDYVQRLLAEGADLGYKQVSLLNKDGKAAAYASKERVKVEMP